MTVVEPESVSAVITHPSVNQLTLPMLEALLGEAEQLRIVERRLSNGCRMIDAGIEVSGGLEAGRRIAEICMGGLGHVMLNSDGKIKRWPLSLNVYSSDPVLACLGSQYAGWSLAHGKGKGAFHALGSGPGRSLAGKEALFGELAYCDSGDSTCLVLEVDQFPPLELTEKIAHDCGVEVTGLTLILTPNRSLAGTRRIHWAFHCTTLSMVPAVHHCHLRHRILSPVWAVPTTPFCMVVMCTCLLTEAMTMHEIWPRSSPAVRHAITANPSPKYSRYTTTTSLKSTPCYSARRRSRCPAWKAATRSMPVLSMNKYSNDPLVMADELAYRTDH